MKQNVAIDFFTTDSDELGPKVSDHVIARAERKLGVRLPQAYLALISQRNGRTPKRQCFPTRQPTSWARDHLRVQTLIGIGYEDGLDGEFGSEYLVEEWGYPKLGVVVFDTPSAGHDTVMLDYSTCGPEGEPRVAYVDEDRGVLLLAESFDGFVASLVDCSEFGV